MLLIWLVLTAALSPDSELEQAARIRALEMRALDAAASADAASPLLVDPLRAVASAAASSVELLPVESERHGPLPDAALSAPMQPVVLQSSGLQCAVLRRGARSMPQSCSGRRPDWCPHTCRSAVASQS